MARVKYMNKEQKKQYNLSQYPKLSVTGSIYGIIMKKSIYVNYKEARKQLLNKTYNLLNDSFGQYDTGKYSIDLTVRYYDGNICIDFDVYDISDGKENASHRDGGLICKANKLPFTEHGFWKLVQKKVDKYITELK